MGLLKNRLPWSVLQFPEGCACDAVAKAINLEYSFARVDEVCGPGKGDTSNPPTDNRLPAHAPTHIRALRRCTTAGGKCSNATESRTDRATDSARTTLSTHRNKTTGARGLMLHSTCPATPARRTHACACAQQTSQRTRHCPCAHERGKLLAHPPTHKLQPRARRAACRRQPWPRKAARQRARAPPLGGTLPPPQKLHREAATRGLAGPEASQTQHFASSHR